jgi:chaperonin GroEL
MSKIIEFGPEARKKLVNGIDKLSNAVTSTLGPNGRNVVISNNQGYPQSTKDGVTVAKTLHLKIQLKNWVLNLLNKLLLKQLMEQVMVQLLLHCWPKKWLKMV